MITAQIYCECCKRFDDTHDNDYVEKYNIEVCMFCYEEEHYKSSFKNLNLHNLKEEE